VVQSLSSCVCPAFGFGPGKRLFRQIGVEPEQRSGLAIPVEFREWFFEKFSGCG
jgi:hypothetical protein